MADRPSRVNLQPTEDDWELIDEVMEFDGSDVPAAYRASLRSRVREIRLLKDVLNKAAADPVKAPAKGKGTPRRKR